MNLQSKFGYCIITQTLNIALFESGTELRTDRQTDKRMDNPITRCPQRTFQAGGIKRQFNRRCVCEALMYPKWLFQNQGHDQGHLRYRIPQVV